MTLREAAEKYVELTIWIRELSSPQLTDLDNADKYREKLLRNFRRIGELAKINGAVLNEYLSPVLDGDRLLTEEEIQVLLDLKDQLVDPYNNENLDIPLLFLVTQRLYEDAERKQDDAALVRSLDDYVVTAYALFSMNRRIYPFCDSAYVCRRRGERAVERILEYLPPEKLETLPEGFTREAILTNARYGYCLHDYPLTDSDLENGKPTLQLLRRALSCLDEPAYRRLVPEFDWVHHEFRTLQYLSDMTMCFNTYRLNREELLELNGYAKRLLHIWETQQAHLHDRNVTESILLSASRCACLAGEITVPAYRKELRRLQRQVKENRYIFDNVTLLATLPIEYVLTLDPKNLGKKDAETVTRFYRELIRYLHRMPKRGHLSFLMTELIYLLNHFIEVEDGIDFESMCMELLAAIHPPTYVHSLSVADLSACLARNLYKKQPEMFVNTPGYPDLEAIEEHVWHAAACHDIGKLFIVETIITYGRKLYEREFDWIRSHPDVGISLLEKHEQTRPYADAARGHHRWYNGKGGYPESYHPEENPDRVTVDLVSCADCLDAATDSVGRSFKTGKTLDDFIVELKAGAGTQYAPYLPELFEDEHVYRELDDILNAGREKKYHQTYDILKNVLR